MSKYVIAFTPDDESSPTHYWDGFDKTEEISDAQVFTNRSEVRSLNGRLQAAFGNEDVQVLPVTLTVSPTK